MGIRESKVGWCQKQLSFLSIFKTKLIYVFIHHPAQIPGVCVCVCVLVDIIVLGEEAKYGIGRIRFMPLLQCVKAKYGIILKTFFLV